MVMLKYEPHHEKSKDPDQPAKQYNQIKDYTLLYFNVFNDSDSGQRGLDQTVWMCRLIKAFADRICLIFTFKSIIIFTHDLKTEI